MSLYSLAQSQVKQQAKSEAEKKINAAVESLPESEDKLKEEINKVVKTQLDQANQDTSKLIHDFTKYIPGESITLYLAALPAATTVELGGLFYIFGAILTPVILILIASALDRKQRESTGRSKRKSLFVPPKEWPKWKMGASFIAFLVWGISIPGNPVFYSANGEPLISPFLITFLILLSSISLALIGDAIGADKA